MLGRYRSFKSTIDEMARSSYFCIFSYDFDTHNKTSKTFPMSTSMKRLYLKRAIRTPLSTHSSDKINEIELNENVLTIEGNDEMSPFVHE